MHHIRQQIYVLLVIGILGAAAWAMVATKTPSEPPPQKQDGLVADTSVSSHQSAPTPKSEHIERETSQEERPAPEERAATNSKIVLIVVNGATYHAPWENGDTVLDVMRALSGVSDFSFTTKEFPGLGEFVETVNGKKNGGGSYWMLYINGEQADKGVSQTRIMENDVIEWKYEHGY